MSSALGSSSRHDYAAVVLGAFIGMGCGFSPLYIGTVGIFVPSLIREFHWSREMAVSSYSVSMLAMSLVGPVSGWLMDRFGARRVIACSAAVFVASMLCLSVQQGNTVLWIVLAFITGMSGAATTSLGYLTLFPQWFSKRLGLAISLGMLGVGFGGIVWPLVGHYMIDHVGWRAGYRVLAALSLLGSAIAVLLVRERLHSGNTELKEISSAFEDAGVASAWRVLTIFILAFVASSSTFSFLPHLPSLFMDRGISATDASRSLSMIGTGILVGRFLTGMLLDRTYVPLVGLIFFGGGAVGFWMIANTQGYHTALFACVCIGLVIGAEGDLLSYIVRKYIGLRHYGTFYGIAISGYGLGAVAGPLAVGRYFDLVGNYWLPLKIAPVLLLMASALLFALGHYARPKLMLETVRRA